MPLPTWGMLAKGADDSELIEQAIARLIQEHNEDESAHLGEGQSLNSHKASEIIDHVVDSIVTDKILNGAITGIKITNDQIVGKDFRTAQDVGETVDGVKFDSDGIEMWEDGELKVNIPKTGNASFFGDVVAKRLFTKDFCVSTNFISIDGWDKSATGTDASIVNSICYLDLRAGDEVGSRARISSEFGGASIDWDNDEPYLGVKLKPFLEDNADFYVGIGSYYPLSYSKFMAIWWDSANGDLWFVWGDGTHLTGIKHEDFDPSGWHTYKIAIGPNGYVHTTIDGGSYQKSNSNVPSGSDDYILDLSVHTKVASGPELLVRGLEFGKENL